MRIRMMIAVLASVLACLESANAQATLVGQVRMKSVGAGIAGALLNLQSEDGSVGQQRTTDVLGNFTFTGLAAGRYRITVSQPSLVPATASVALANNETQTLNVDLSDEPEDDGFYAAMYLGLAIDTFAAAEHLNYLNPNLSQGPRERGIVGIDFSKRLTAGRRPLTIYGETVHGARTTEINCENNKLFVCRSNHELIGAVATPDPSQAAEDFVYIMRNASSLEGFMALRWDAVPVAGGASLYLKGQAGFLTIAEDGRGAKNLHQVGVGLIQKTGQFSNSYLEVGFGRSDLFESHRRRRLKVDALLTAPIIIDDGGSAKRFFSKFQPFAQITVDADLGFGADSIQSYIGLEFILKK
jgi:hypothetical protein